MDYLRGHIWLNVVFLKSIIARCATRAWSPSNAGNSELSLTVGVVNVPVTVLLSTVLK